MADINTDNVGDDLAKAFDDGFEQGKKATMRWISVKDRLPKRGEKVLAYMDFSKDPEVDFENEICQNTYRGKLVGTKKDVWAWQGDYVTHWMPLPEPPEEAEDNFLMQRFLKVE